MRQFDNIDRWCYPSLGGTKMKGKFSISVGLAVLLIAFTAVPPAEAHWRHYGGGGGVILGFGAGLATGIILAPRPVYVPPPVYVVPPPVVVYPSPNYYPPAPPPQEPPASGYEQQSTVVPPPPAANGNCREWRMIDRHLEDRWDSYYGRWQTVPVERWGWVEVPCK